MPNTAHRVATLPPELQRRVDAELASGERIVWTGQPVPWLFARHGWASVVIGIPWTGFVLFWMAGAAGMVDGRPWQPGEWEHILLPLWGVPFFLIGLVLLTMPYWLARNARRTIYALTDRRAIVWEAESLTNTTIRSFTPDRLLSMTRRERGGGGRGDLIFEQFQERNGSGTTTIRRGFMSIEQLNDTEELVRETLLAAHANRGAGTEVSRIA